MSHDQTRSHSVALKRKYQLSPHWRYRVINLHGYTLFLHVRGRNRVLPNGSKETGHLRDSFIDRQRCKWRWMRSEVNVRMAFTCSSIAPGEKVWILFVLHPEQCHGCSSGSFSSGWDFQCKLYSLDSGVTLTHCTLYSFMEIHGLVDTVACRSDASGSFRVIGGLGFWGLGLWSRDE